MKKLLWTVAFISSGLQCRQLTDSQLQDMQESYLEDVPKVIFSSVNEQQQYKEVYSRFLEDITNMSDVRRARKLKSVYKWSLHVLEGNNPEYYQQLALAGQLQTPATRAFLTRYAVYHKMLIHQVHQQEKVAFKKSVSEYSKKVANSVTKASRSLKSWLLS